MRKRSVLAMTAMGVVVALMAVAAPVSNQAGGPAPGGMGPAATPVAPGHPVQHPAAALPGSGPQSSPEITPPVLRTPATDDAPTTVPTPLDMPNVKNLEVLMEKMKAAHKRTSDPNPEVARKAAKDVGQYALASLHPRFRDKDPRWVPLAEDLYFKNQAVQKALEPGTERAEFLAAFKGQNESCNACHRVFRKEN